MRIVDVTKCGAEGDVISHPFRKQSRKIDCEAVSAFLYLFVEPTQAGCFSLFSLRASPAPLPDSCQPHLHPKALLDCVLEASVGNDVLDGRRHALEDNATSECQATQGVSVSEEFRGKGQGGV